MHRSWDEIDKQAEREAHAIKKLGAPRAPRVKVQGSPKTPSYKKGGQKQKQKQKQAVHPLFERLFNNH